MSHHESHTLSERTRIIAGRDMRLCELPTVATQLDDDAIGLNLLGCLCL
jgi:hypothetical protein